MKLTRTILVLASTTAIGMAGGAAGTAMAAPKGAYPKPVHQYVTHPKGFNDASEVRIVGGKVKCDIKLEKVTHGDVSVTVRSDLAPLVKELLRATEQKHNYNLRKGDTGGYDCRFIRGSSTSISNHSYGRAVDMNWNDNPMSSTFKSNIPPAVVKMWMEHGFFWGGHYNSRPDTMHFEYVAPKGKIDDYVASARKIGKPEPTKPPSSPKPTKTATPRPTKTATPKPTKTTTPKPTKTTTPKPTKTTTPKPTKTTTPKPTKTTTPKPTKSATRPTGTPRATTPVPPPTTVPEPTTPVETLDPTTAPAPTDPAPTEVPSDPGTSEPGTSEPGTSDPGTSDPGASQQDVPADPHGSPDSDPGAHDHDEPSDPMDPGTEGGLANTGAEDDLWAPGIGGLAGLVLGSALIARRRR